MLASGVAATARSSLVATVGELRSCSGGGGGGGDGGGGGGGGGESDTGSDSDAGAAGAGAGAVAGAGSCATAATFPSLPPEIWQHILTFLRFSELGGLSFI